MVTRPGASHCVNSLSQKVGLSRSVFMSRFTVAFGCSPMAVLRQLRMRQAAELLTTSHLSIDQVSYVSGTRVAVAFFRAFRKAYGSDPSDYRAITPRKHDRIPAPYVSQRAWMQFQSGANQSRPTGMIKATGAVQRRACPTRVNGRPCAPAAAFELFQTCDVRRSVSAGPGDCRGATLRRRSLPLGLGEVVFDYLAES